MSENSTYKKALTVRCRGQAVRAKRKGRSEADHDLRCRV